MEAIGEDASLRLDQKRTVEAVRNGYSFFQENDVAFAKVTPCFENGKAAVMLGLAGGIGFGTTEITVARANSRIYNRFLFFVLTEDRFRKLGKSSMTGAGGLKRVPDLFTKDFSFQLPSLAEQRQIVGFLDREIAQIDELVFKQESLIALLAEKRQAIITHAVTKGLDQTVPTKPSSVTWLGDIPSGWTVRKSAQLFRAQKGREAAELTKEACAEMSGPFPVYSGQTANRGVMASIDHYEFDSGSEGVLFSTTVGARAMSVSQVYGKFSLSQNCMIIRRIASLDTRYFYYQFQVVFRYQRGLIPDHMQASFRMEDLYGYLLAVPSEQEQRDISKYLDGATNKLDALASRASVFVKLLKERRTALISAAVTGKIDVLEGTA